MSLERLLKASLLAAMATGLVACGGDDDDGGTTPPPPVADVCPEFAEDVDGATEADPICRLSGTLTGEIELTADTLWVLAGGVFVGEDAGPDADAPADVETGVLNIEAGTTIVGESGEDFLVVRRGSQIVAEGTAAAPILMTSSTAFDAGGSADRGEWGGLIINGRAPINGCDAGICEAEGEGGSGLYGGNDADDDSGVLNYVIVSNAGHIINDEDELNGIAFQGVGRGTEVDYVQVNLNADDGVEFFGGTVEVKHLVLTGIADDSMDWTGGWQGGAQFVVIRQFADDGDKGIEADNNGDDNEAAPVAKPLLANFTMVGEDAITEGGGGVLLREGTGANLYNFIVTNFTSDCLDLDQEFTFTNAGADAAAAAAGTQLTIDNSIVFGCAGDTFNDNETEDQDTADVADDFTDPWLVSDWFNGGTGNSDAAIDMNGVFVANDADIDGLGATPVGTFLDEVDYIGAFEPGTTEGSATDWTSGWILEGTLD